MKKPEIKTQVDVGVVGNDRKATLVTLPTARVVGKGLVASGNVTWKVSK